ncbi:MAG TPA: ABC transporter ATP-binding protein [Bacillota bacterium]|nr:ABC transporter ATP-binding protein [Bacillota bacterium]
MDALLLLQDICKSYYLGEEEQPVLKDINLRVQAGEFVAVLGPSGSGKTTLMNIIGCLDVPTCGHYVLDGIAVDTLGEKAMARVRNQKIGFVFQNFQLLPRLTALGNVELPLVYSGLKAAERRAKAVAVLEQVGLADKLRSYPNQLSGGQQQRVAIARAMVTNPAIILADEPTGALDQATGLQIMELFCELNQAGSTIVMITHNREVAKVAARTVRILDGELIEGGEARARRNYRHVRREHRPQ